MNMTEEHITKISEPETAGHTTYVVNTGKDQSGGGFKWFAMILLVGAILFGGYVLMQGNASEIAKDNAVADAAEKVGDAAGKVGDAAGEVGDAAQDAVDKLDTNE